MIGLQDIETIVKLTLMSGYLEDEVPVSVLIITEVEGGKSEMAKRFSANDGVGFPHDITAYGIVKAYGPRLTSNAPQGRRIRHLIFPEFVHCLERQRDTVKTLLNFLNGMVAEGVKEIHTFRTNITLPAPMSAGIIACLTIGEFHAWKDYWHRSGFLSRCLPVTYSYSTRVEEQIFESIFAREYLHDPLLSLPFPRSPVDVRLTSVQSRELKPTAKAIAASVSQTMSPPRALRGFRGQVALQRLAMSSALLVGRTAVEQSDIDLVKRLAQTYMNFQYTAI